MMGLQAIKWENGKLQIIDQLLLPHTTKYFEITGVKDGWNAIHKMQVIFSFSISTSIHLFTL